jgi:hypothetical protein
MELEAEEECDDIWVICEAGFDNRLDNGFDILGPAFAFVIAYFHLAIARINDA